MFPLPFRLIARLDIKGEHVVKGMQMEGLRIVGKPADMALNYANQGADELLYLDIVASLYGRNALEDLVRQTASEVFIPITVGGGIRTCEDIRRLLRAGADKVAINTAAVERPGFIHEAAEQFGAQAIVVQVDAKRHEEAGRPWFEVYVNGGRDPSAWPVPAWLECVVRAGAGEILLTSIDCDGMHCGYDVDLLAEILPAQLPIPIVVGGGAAKPRHLYMAAVAGADGVAIGSMLHFYNATIGQLKLALMANGIQCRRETYDAAPPEIP